MFADGPNLTIDLGELRKVLKRRLEADSALMAQIPDCPHRAPSTYPFPVVPAVGVILRLEIDGLFGYAACVPFIWAPLQADVG
jgi:hypothetical protein